MAYENVYVSDGGLRTWLENCDISNFIINDFSSTYRSREINYSTIDPLPNSNMPLSYGEGGYGEWKNAFGFFMYDKETGEFNNKILFFRYYCYILDPIGGGGQAYLWAFHQKWSIFDAETQQYTDIVNSPDVNSTTGAAQIELPSCRIIFSKRTETINNVEQDVYYGGLLMTTYFSDVTYYESRAVAVPLVSCLEAMGYTIHPEEIERDPNYGPESEPGGYGPEDPSGGGSGGPGPTFDAKSDPWVDYPLKPGIAALGLVNLYKCDVGSLVNLGAELFPDIHFPTSLSDVGAVIAAVSDSIWNSKLIDYIVSAHIIPVDVTGGALTDIKVGTRTLTGILARPISDDVIEFDCGTIHIDEYYTNFVDYMTRCRLYLPFYGMIDIKAEYWQSADLSVKYLFNVIDGSFTVQVFSTVNRHQEPFTSMIGQYTGCACVHVPMTGASYSSMFGGMIANAGGMALSMASGNPAAAATSALNMSQGAMTGANGNMQMSNAYNASAGFYGYPCPYVIIERPISYFPRNYAAENGLPLLVTKTIGTCRGFTTAENIILDGIPCTSDEKERIRNYFKSGVIIR